MSFVPIETLFYNIVVYCINIGKNRISCDVLLLLENPILTHRLKKTERMSIVYEYVLLLTIFITYILAYMGSIHQTHVDVLVLIWCYWSRLTERCQDVLPHSQTLCCGVSRDNFIHLSSSQENNAIRLIASQVDT